MVYTSPQGTVYKYEHRFSSTVHIAVKADNNTMQLNGFHSMLLKDKQPVALGGNWTVVQNVHILTQEEQSKLGKAIESYVKHNGKWTPPKGFGAEFIDGCLIVWPKNTTATEISMRQYMEVIAESATRYHRTIPPYKPVDHARRLRQQLMHRREQFDKIGPTQSNTGKSDGSSADYYELPQDCAQLQDLISHCDMNAQMGEIFRAAYRYGRASHSDKLRDAKKIKFYIEAEIKRLESE